ncbi:Dscam, partial [Cordylochernes scorpioides]
MTGQKESSGCFLISGSKPLSFEWKKNGMLIHKGVKSEKDFSVIVIDPVGLESMGNYSCTVSNKHGSDTVFAQLDVKGQKESITCFVISGRKPLKFEWKKNGNPIAKDHQNIHIKSEKEFSMIVIDPVGLESMGNYSCTVINKHGTDVVTAQLTVKASPRWIQKPTDTSVARGENVTLVCSADGFPPPRLLWKRIQDIPQLQPITFRTNVLSGQKESVNCFAISGTKPLKFEWKKDGSLITKDTPHIHIKTEKDFSVILIDPVGLESMGNYSCTVSNKAGTDVATAQLTVKESPTLRPIAFRNNIQAGQKEYITCFAISGSKPLKFEWKKDGIPITKESSHIQIKSEKDLSFIVIDPVGLESMGNYSCTVSNKVGSDMVTAQMTVRAPPRWLQKPTDTSVARGQNVSLNCSAEGFPIPKISWKRHPNELPNCPWEKVGVDLFTLKGQNYLVIADYYSRYPEIARLEDMTSASIIVHCKSIFARHGIPLEVRSDNGPQFGSLFKEFAHEYGFTHVTSSPRYPQSNGFIESFVKIVKERISKSKDPYLALLAYRATPLANGFSPAELSMGRRVRTTIPTPAKQHQPPNLKNWKNHEAIQRKKQKYYYDRAKGVRELPPLDVNDRVWLTDLKTPGVIISKADTPRSYVVDTPRGSVRRNRFHLLPTDVPTLRPITFGTNIISSQKESVTCFATSGTKPLNFEWKKDGRAIKKDSNIHIKSEKDFSVIVIDPVRLESMGNYSCTVSNKYGMDTTTAQLSVKASPRWLNKPTDNSVARGQNVSLICSAEGFPRPKISWKKYKVTGEKESSACFIISGSKPLTFEWRKDGNLLEKGVKSEKDFSVLMIDPVGLESMGNYSCTVKNKAGSDMVTAQLTVRASPRWLERPTDTSVARGQNVTLTCAAEGFPAPRLTWTRSYVSLRDLCVNVEAPKLRTITFRTKITAGEKESVTCLALKGSKPLLFEWKKDDKPISKGSPNIQIESKKDLSFIVIDPVGLDSMGNYSCTVSNKHGTDMVSAMLTVQASPQWIKKPTDSSFARGQNVSLECVAEGYPLPKISWKKIPDPVVLKSTGNYSCTASNKAGSDTVSAQLVVKASPRWLEKPSDISFPRSQNVSIVCSAEGYPAPRIVWTHYQDVPRLRPISFRENILSGEKESSICFAISGDKPLRFEWSKDGVPITRDFHQIQIKSEKELSVIVLDPVGLESMGNYSCTVSNKAGTDVVSAMLIVKASPRWLHKPSDISVPRGHNVSLSCAAEGYPLPHVSWSKQLEKPRLRPFQFRENIISGEKESSTCFIISGNKPLKFEWKKNGVPITKESPHIQIKYEKDFSVIVIDPVGLESMGNYSCTVSNKHGTEVVTAQLTVRAPPRWLEKPSDISVARGQNVSLNCSAKGFPVPRVIWKKYQEAPRLRPIVFRNNILEGEREISTCYAISGSGKSLSFEWKKDGVPIATKSSSNINTKSEKDFSMIVIDPVGLESMGNYSCTVSNKHGSDVATAQLVVRAPPRWRQKPTDTSVARSENVTLVCSAEGYPVPKVTWNKLLKPPKIRKFTFRTDLTTGEKDGATCLVVSGAKPFTFAWKKDGSPIQEKQSSIQIKIEKDYSLIVIDPVGLDLVGNYSCTVTNKAGTDVVEAQLTVRAPPRWLERPTDTSVARGHNVTITCAAEAYPPPKIVWKKHQDAPKIRPFYFRQDLVEGEKDSTTCLAVSGKKPFNFSWKKDGHVLTEKNANILVKPDFSVIFIEPVSLESMGNYSCTVSNKAGSDVVTAQLAVRDREMVSSTEVYVHGGTTQVANILNISNIDKDMGGQYICSAENGVGQLLSTVIHLHVTGRPPALMMSQRSIPVKFSEIRSFTFRKDLKEGMKESVTCLVVEGKRPYQFEWKKNGEVLTGSQAVKIRTEKEFSVILVDPVKLESSGNYTCVVSNVAGRDQFTALLQVTAPPRWMSRPQNVMVPRGGNVTLPCLVIGFPAPAVTWSRVRDNGEEEILQTSNFTLYLPNVSPGLAGGYMCRARNGVEPELETSVMITVT